MSSGGIEFVSWTDNNGTKYNFGTQEVYEPLLGYYVYGLASGSSATVRVEAGSNPITFELPGNTTDYRTTEVITIEARNDKTFTFYSSTYVQAMSLFNNSIAIQSFNEQTNKTVSIRPTERDKKLRSVKDYFDDLTLTIPAVFEP